MTKPNEEKDTERIDPSELPRPRPGSASAAPDEKPLDDEDITRVVPKDRFRDTLAEATQAPPALVCLIGPGSVQGKRWEIRSSSMSIGRSIQNQILIDDLSVSKRHASLRKKGAEIFLTDLESTNGTIVNGHSVPGKTPLKLRHNDQIEIGSIILKFLESGSIESISHQQSYDMRLRDPLTQIYNKGAFMSKARECFKRASILDADMCIVVIDLDHFKRVNDTCGHDAGDAVLREMAQVIQTHVIRSEDFFARYGGEEFVLILMDRSLDLAVTVADRARSVIESHRFMIDDKPHAITISAGVAARQPDMTRWEDLFKVADRALYQSKKNGRNRTTVLQRA